MTVSVTRKRIRLAFDSKDHTQSVDVLSQVVPLIWRGESVQIEIGLFLRGAIVDSKTNIAQLVLEIHDSSRATFPLVQKTLQNAAVATPTAEEWAAGTSQHGLFLLDYADTQFDMSRATDNVATFWLVVHIVTTDAQPLRLTQGGCSFKVEEDGAQNDLAIVPLSAPTFRIINGNLCLYNKTTGRFQAVWMEGEADQETLKWGAQES